MKSKKQFFAWLKAAGIRAVKTFGQTAGGVLTGSAVLYDVDWKLVFGSASVAAFISLCMSLGGLPELPDENGNGIPDEVE